MPFDRMIVLPTQTLIPMHTDRKYVIDKRSICRWKPELDDQYLSSFNMRNIQKFQQQLAAIISNMSHATQELIDHLYTNMKELFIEPANSTGIYREYTNHSRIVGKNGMGEKHGLIVSVKYYVRNV